MSSEAAQKAYPDTQNEAGSLSRSNAPVQREAFDRGAVEALRQVRSLHEEREWRRLDGTYLGGTVCDSCRREWPCATVREVDRMIEEREVGQ